MVNFRQLFAGLNPRQLFTYYVVISTPIFCTLGLVFSYKLVGMTYLEVLITHISEAVGESKYDLRQAAIIENFMEGLRMGSVVLFAFVADVHTGRYVMVVYGAGVCVAGLFLSFIASRTGTLNFGCFIPALVLLSLGRGALSVTLPAFLDDQLREIDVNEERRRRRTKFWWFLLSFAAAIFSIFGPRRLTFKYLAVELALVTGASFLMFVSGTMFYNFVDAIENPFRDLGMVIVRALQNINADYSSDTQILPPVPCLRWLDKAATVQGSETGSVEQVSRVKRLFRMLPLWSCFLFLSLVLATGDTFFIIEATSLVKNYDLTPIIILNNLAAVTEFVVSIFSRFVIRKLRERRQFNKQKMELVRIGLGMSCSVSCCLVAWAISMARMSPNMNVYWLTLQYILLGVTAGLCTDGFSSLFRIQGLESLLSFGPPFGQLARALGELASVPFIMIFSGARFKWIQKDLEHSHLDKYYLFMAGLSIVNVFMYCLVAWWYGDDAFLAGDGEMGLVDELIHGVASGFGELQDTIPVGDGEMGLVDGLFHGVTSGLDEMEDPIPMEDEEMNIGGEPMEGVAPGSEEWPYAFPIGDGEMGLTEGLIELQNIVSGFM
ncbi:protein NRT1/ PTR FAMILY 5.11-like [Salvia divinorum]|uniref:Protein NRT1/ PTR FAMILY 5.11-like n=1 Tax=Salvia divinorum TaxID=28513 RepID=A0ABD1FHS6_SALDI